jgi:hypothetical protein
MIEFADRAPDTNVIAAEYQRLLGYPREWRTEGRAAELAEGARDWFAKHGKPWVYAREAGRVAINDDAIVIDGVAFTGGRFRNTLREAGADRVVLVAASAGPELELEAQRLWADEKPDEYFFLEIFGSAIVEHLVMTAGARLCAIADREEYAVLPHYSPGYPGWEISEQAKFYELVSRTRDHELPARIEVLESGMLRPKKSLLAAFGMTSHVDRVRPLSDLIPCEGCTLAGCQYRRAPYVRPRRRSEVEAMTPAATVARVFDSVKTLARDAKYSLSTKALRRWADERLSLKHNTDGTTDALFRFDGTTCSNMGRTFRFDYAVKLGTRDDGYIVLEQHCTPSPGDTGHQAMCRYRSAGATFLDSIKEEQPLVGRPLNDVLSWERQPAGASCYCESESGTHKWGLVLETIHFALAQKEKQPA